MDSIWLTKEVYSKPTLSVAWMFDTTQKSIDTVIDKFSPNHPKNAENEDLPVEIRFRSIHLNSRNLPDTVRFLTRKGLIQYQARIHRLSWSGCHLGQDSRVFDTLIILSWKHVPLLPAEILVASRDLQGEIVQCLKRKQIRFTLHSQLWHISLGSCA